ncbi:hypothetical protein [Aestuariispira insulae]|uniref:hypothetical protein n=1 Tax=Aestuariispira insulae TaxID=1461337 RepID=UPI000E287491|nr:hypothetical protein [Aestuariispira insulae]
MINILNALVTEATRQPNEDIARQLARKNHSGTEQSIIKVDNYSYRNVIVTWFTKIWRHPQIGIVAAPKPWNNAGT